MTSVGRRALLFIAAMIFTIAGAIRAPLLAQPALRQGWNSTEWGNWYIDSQGSRLLPLSWALSLEVPSSTDKILSDSNLEHFKYLTDRDRNGLPLGFAKDAPQPSDQLNAGCVNYPTLCDRNRRFTSPWKDFPSQPWVGLNCAACHTNDIKYGQHKLRIDGAPAFADFQGFLEQVLQAIKRTAEDPAKFDRFSRSVLGASFNAPNKDALAVELRAVISWEQQLHNRNSTPLRYGFGRLDAQGHILNKVALIVGAHTQLPSPPDAPASYPHLWDAPQEDNIQWNGLVKNDRSYTVGGKKTSLGALGRNVGEVIGVFAHIDVHHQDALGGYKSTARIGELILMERQLARLLPPAWPEYFPPIDSKKKQLGEIIYFGRTDPLTNRSFADIRLGNCVSCHAIRDRHNSEAIVPARMYSISEVGTDIWLACNTYNDLANSGDLAGRRAYPLSSTRLGAQESTANLLSHTVIGSLVGGRLAIAKQALADLFGPKRQTLHPYQAVQIKILPGVSDEGKLRLARQCLNQTNKYQVDNHLAYKARPLDGIWATGPFLHNGSVPTLYDLLLPAKLVTWQSSGLFEETRDSGTVAAKCPDSGKEHVCTRPEEFSVGSREFDPIKVGFVSTPNLANTFEFHVRDQNGVPIQGNYNSGHEYGTQLADDERWALIEYLKTL